MQQKMQKISLIFDLANSTTKKSYHNNINYLMLLCC